MNLKKLEKYLRVNLLGPDPRLMGRGGGENLLGRGLTKVEKQWSRPLARPKRGGDCNSKIVIERGTRMWAGFVWLREDRVCVKW